jgi:hypothetical protein
MSPFIATFEAHLTIDASVGYLFHGWLIHLHIWACVQSDLSPNPITRCNLGDRDMGTSLSRKNAKRERMSNVLSEQYGLVE